MSVTNDSPTAAGATNVLLNQRASAPPYHREPVHIQGDENAGKAIGFGSNGVLTAIAVGGVVVNVKDFGAVGDGVADDTAEIQAALTAATAAGGAADGRSTVVCPTGCCFKISATIVIPNNATLDISGTIINCSVVTAFTLGTFSRLVGDNAIINTSGGSGAAIKKTSAAAVNTMSVLGWPRLYAAALRQAGSIALDFTGSYKGVFELSAEGYETAIYGGTGIAGPQTYYNEIRSPKVVGSVTAIKLNGGANSTVIINPQINGTAVGTYGIRVDGASGLAILGGWVENFVDSAATRGLLVNDASTVTVTGTIFEGPSTGTSFAIGITGTVNAIAFLGVTTGIGWSTSTRVVSNTSSGTYAWLGNCGAEVWAGGAFQINKKADLVDPSASYAAMLSAASVRMTTNQAGSELLVGLDTNAQTWLQGMHTSGAGKAILLNPVSGDVKIGAAGVGIILKSPDGSPYRVAVANGGTLSITSA